MKVLVIGAGIIGVSIADALAQRGADVSVLDMRSPGRGASQASAGILAPYSEAHEHSPLLALGARSLDLFDDFIAGVSGRTGRRIEYARAGTLDVALSDDVAGKFRQERDRLVAKGVAAEWIDAAALRSFDSSVTPRALGGLLISAHGVVGVSALTDALVHSARLAGATFEAPIEVAQVKATKSAVEVRAGDRTYTADAVVVASGSWSRRVKIAGVAPLPVKPVRGQLLHLQWPDDAPLPTRVIWGPGCYAAPWSNRSVLIGATVEDVGFNEQRTVAGVRDLTNAACELLPDAARATLEHVRVGLRPALPDGLPAIGAWPSAPRVFAATGHYRNGVLLAPLTAKLVERLLLDDDLDAMLRDLAPSRFS